MTPIASHATRDRSGRLLLVLALVAGLLAAAVSPVSAAKPQKADFWLTILHNNDGESKLLEVLADPADPATAYAGISRFVALMGQLRDDARHYRGLAGKHGAITLSSGDNYLAGAEFAASLEHGVPFYDSLAASAIGYDAMAIGNHEFDFGPDTLADYISGIDPRIPFVSANLDLSGEPRLAALAAAGRIVPSIVIKEKGEQIGIVGATTPQLPNISSPRNVIVNEVAPAVQAEVDRLTATGVNKIILISHLQDVNEDLDLAGSLKGVDVMIAGGGDELLASEGDLLSPGDAGTTPAGSYPLTATGGDGATIPVVTTAGNYKYIGRLVVGFDRDGRVTAIPDALSGPVRVVGEGYPDGVAPDPAVEASIVAPVTQFIAELAANVLAQSEVPLNGLRGSVAGETILTPGVRNSETNLGNLTADSLLWQAQQLAGEFGVDSPQVGMQNGGGIRNDSVIPAGSITELNTFQILAFTNFVSVKEDMTPEQLKVVLETSVSAIGNGRFGQWAGLTFTYDLAAEARVIDGDTCVVSTAGDRVQDVFVGGVQVFDDGVFVGPAGWTVDLATNDFTFRGGDCYDFGPGGFTTLGTTYQQALVNYLVDGLGGAITAADYPVGGEGRITQLP
ncbi:MAG TPA: 5'-nucleotidase C-terminal domain-containing protein [Candidatus Limnocylindria bacterium]|nr:5'-nucleotidase C-terminal domain-containing protein [Candidatus Limnocylindria bacterium]